MICRFIVHYSTLFFTTNFCAKDPRLPQYLAALRPFDRVYRADWKPLFSFAASYWEAKDQPGDLFRWRARFRSLPWSAAPFHSTSLLANLTPDKSGLPEGGHTFEQFRQIMRHGTDFDHLHPSCTSGPDTQPTVWWLPLTAMFCRSCHGRRSRI